MTKLLLDSLEITGFRAFEQLAIEHLGRINLIVGKNNVGKSCLLEALRLYAYRGAPEVIREILTARDEMGDIEEQHVTGKEDYFDAVKFLFYGRRPDYQSGRIDIGTIGKNKKRFSIIFKWLTEEFDSKNNRKLVDAEPIHFAEGIVYPGLSMVMENDAIIVSQISRFFERSFNTLPWSQRVQEIPCSFVSAYGPQRDSAAALWDKVTLKPEEDHVTYGLRIIAPDVERVTFIGQSGRKRIPVVKLRDLPDPIPLRSLGEGTNRIFGILLALVNAQNGLLLIDEVDSGLHYTVHSNLWQLIFAVAERLNVQVFATTHSWDCIEGFQQNLLEMPDKGMLIRLENRQGHIVPILFDGARLGIATRQDIEVR
jgi:hypothetical protein